MTRILFVALIAIPFLSSGQGTGTATPLKPLPDYTYVTPDMTIKQIDSLIAALGPYDLELSFDTLEYDENNRIKKISGSLYGDDEYFLVSSANFSGMTIIKRGEKHVAVVMGLYYPPKKKEE